MEAQLTERGITLESTAEGDRKTITCSFDTYDEIIQIEKAASTIAASNEGEVKRKNTKKGQHLELTNIGAQLFLASRIDTEKILNELDSHALSPIFNAFKEACDETQIKNKLAHKKSHEKWTSEESRVLIELANRIKEKTKKGGFRTALNNHIRSSNKNTRESIKYIRGLFSNHARILVLRIDLGYQRSIRAKHKNSKLLEIAKTQRSEIFKNLKSHFKSSLLGYIWKLGYGLEKGYHYHVMLFLDGSQKRQDVTIAKIIGEHWNNEITKGEGNYFNCNA
ncbi:YagK/YfjJ domain-containing protein [Pseudomonas aeruginosa]